MIKQFYDSLSQGKIQEALDGMAVIEGISESLKARCVLLSNRLATLEEQNWKGVVSFDNYNLERNRISLAVYQILKEIENPRPWLKLTDYPTGFVKKIGLSIILIGIGIASYFIYSSSKKSPEKSPSVEFQVLVFENDSLYKHVNKKALKYLLSLFNKKYSTVPITLVDVPIPDSLKYNRERLDYMVEYSKRQSEINKLEKNAQKQVNYLGFVEFSLPGNPLLMEYDGFSVFTLSGMESDSTYKFKDKTIPLAYRYIIYISLVHVFFTKHFKDPVIIHSNFTGCAFDYSKDRTEKFLFLENPTLCASHKKILDDYYSLPKNDGVENILSFNWLNMEEIEIFQRLIRN